MEKDAVQLIDDLVMEGAMLMLPGSESVLGLGYGKVTGKAFRFSIPFPEDQSHVHELEFTGLLVEGEDRVAFFDRGGLIGYLAPIKEWSASDVGDFVDVKARWDAVLQDPEEKSSYFRFIEEDAI